MEDRGTLTVPPPQGPGSVTMTTAQRSPASLTASGKHHQTGFYRFSQSVTVQDRDQDQDRDRDQGDREHAADTSSCGGARCWGGGPTDSEYLYLYILVVCSVSEYSCQSVVFLWDRHAMIRDV